MSIKTEFKKRHTNWKRLSEIAPPQEKAQLGQESWWGHDLGRHQAMKDQLKLCTLWLVIIWSAAPRVLAVPCTLCPHLRPSWCAPLPPRYRSVTNSSGPATINVGVTMWRWWQMQCRTYFNTPGAPTGAEWWRSWLSRGSCWRDCWQATHGH